MCLPLISHKKQNDRIIMRKCLLFIFLLVTTATRLLAQQDTMLKQLDEVIITSQRTAQKDINIPYSTVSVSSAWLADYRPRTTPEALSGMNGVFVQKTNHGGGSPFLRGLTGNQTLILVDGIRLNNSTFRYGPNQYLNTIDALNISKMEIAKGTGSVQYGSDAIGGVLQVFTREPAFSTGMPSWSGRVLGKYMTGNMEKTVRGEAAYSGQKFSAAVGATYRNFGDLIGGDTSGKQSPSGYKEFAFDTKLKFLLRPNTVLTVANQFLQQQHVPVYHKVVLENFGLNEFHPQSRMLNYARLNISTNSSLLNKIEIIGSWQKSMEGRNSRKNGTFSLRKESDEVNTLGFTTDVSSVFTKSWTANSGVEIYADKVNSKTELVNTQSGSASLLRGLYPNNAANGNYSLYSLHHFTFDNWIVEAGARYNIFSIRISDTTLGKVKINPSSFVYNASLLYKLTQYQSVYLSFNTGFRAPNVDDMGTLGIVDFRYEIPTGNLAPERSRNIELGYKLRSNKWAASISGYYMHLSNLITRVKLNNEMISGYPVYRKENLESGYIKGFETAIDYQPVAGWYFNGNVSYTMGQALTKNEPLRRIPPLNGRLLSRYSYKKWSATGELLFASKQSRLAQGDKDDNRIPKGGTPGWKVLNFYTSYEMAAVRLNLGAQNILNVDYRTHGSGINGVGRSAWLALELKL
jgi:outer membrane receptor protein involved in Fe transport